MYLIEEALTSWLLNEYKKPVITKEEISLQIYLFYLKKEYNGERIYQIRKNKAGPNEFEKNILKLLKCYNTSATPIFCFLLSILIFDKFACFSIRHA